MTYDDIIIVAVPALIGGAISMLSTLLVTRHVIKAKRSESELNYKRKWEERYILNAQKHWEVYVSLDTALRSFQTNWIKSKKNNLQDLKSEIDKLKSLKESLGEKGLTAFLTPDIESCFDRLLNFLSKSQGASQVRYGIIEKYKMLGEEKSSYNVLPEDYGKNRASVLGFRVGFHLGNRVNIIIGLIDDYEYKIIFDSAPLDSKEFNKQLSDSLVEIKNKIKGVTLGPGANIV